MKVYIMTMECQNAFGQPIRYTGAYDADYIETAIANAILEGYKIVSVEERK